jgi:glyoxylase-like metal-dependent hydrolase (beta-lactamase superfamily II)
VLNRNVIELLPGIRRVTFALPLGIDHVHCYFLRSADGTWTLVDTGLGADDPEAVWEPVLAALDGPVERIVVTHLHPDHVGGSADVAALTGARVLQGRLDHKQCVGAWGDERTAMRSAAHFASHGMPAETLERLRGESMALRGRVRFVRDAELLDPGDRVDGWEILHLPGHADGHIALLRDGVLIAGDTVLGRITPTVGLYQQSRPDPLGDYLASLDRIAALAPAVAFAGHEEVIDDPAGRVRELVHHHSERMEEAERALGPEGRTAYDISFALFPADLPPSQRRFAVAETLAHLERLVLEERAERAEGDRHTLYCR